MWLGFCIINLYSYARSLLLSKATALDGWLRRGAPLTTPAGHTRAEPEPSKNLLRMLHRVCELHQATNWSHRYHGIHACVNFPPLCPVTNAPSLYQTAHHGCGITRTGRIRSSTCTFLVVDNFSEYFRQFTSGLVCINCRATTANTDVM